MYMKDTFTKFGAVAVALLMSGLPAVALAEDSTENTSTVQAVSATGSVAPEAREAILKRAQLEAVAAKRAALASTTAQMRAAVQEKTEAVRDLKEERRTTLASTTKGTVLSEEEREAMKQKAEQIREDTKQQLEQVRETFKNRIELIREDTVTPALSIAELKQKIEDRRMKMRDEAASTTPEVRKILENIAPMRTAVHALLSSRELLGGGGIGQQVSDIARQVDESVSTTTNAEAAIRARGFLSKLFFGGDKKKAEEIKQQVTQNQSRLQSLTSLLSEASTTEEVKTELGAQMRSMQEEQKRLEGVARSESKLWGLFSWRF